MEVPCQLTFAGPGKELKKIHCNLARDLSKLAALQMTPCTKEIALECKVEEAPSINSVAHDNISMAIDLRNDEEDIAITNDDESTGDAWKAQPKTC